MNLSELSIKRPVFAWMLMSSLICFGLISFFRMGVSQLPDVDFPVINIALSLDNASPEVMESDVVDTVEDAIMGIAGVRSVRSTSSQGIANVTIEFELNRNVDVALQEVQTRLNQAQKKLPKKMDPPVITKTNPEDIPILWILLTNEGKKSLYEQMNYARNNLKNYFSIIEGVGDIQFAGYVDPNLRVWLDAKKLKYYQLTSYDVYNTILNEQQEVPAGRIENFKKEFNVRLLGEEDSPNKFSKIRIINRGGAPNYNPITLDKVAKIEEGLSDIRALSRYNGQIAVGLGIVKQRGANAVRVSDNVKKKLDQIQARLPSGFQLQIQMDTTKYIKESIYELNFTILLAVILTSIVCYLFLGTFSSTFSVLFSIPTSVIGTFFVLYFFGFTLNTFTLLGLSLAIGIVVDDAIMMLENIVRHREMRKTKLQSALDGSNEIIFAAIATTIAIVAIFTPVIFMKGIVGSYFFQYGVTVTAAVLFSLLAALTFTPMQCAQFLTLKQYSTNFIIKITDRAMDKIAEFYKKLLLISLDHKFKVLFISFLLFILSIFFVYKIKKEFIPAQDQSIFLLTLKTPVGYSLSATDKAFQTAESLIKSNSNVLSTYSSIGNFNGQDIVNTGVIYVILKDKNKRKQKQMEIMQHTRDQLRKELPFVEIFSQDLSLAGFSVSKGFPLEMTIQGSDWNKLVSLSKMILKQMRSNEYFQDVNTDYQENMPEIKLTPNRTAAAQSGVSIQSIGQEVQTFIGGNTLGSNAQYPKDGHRFDIRLRSNPEQHDEVKDLNLIYLRNNRGESGSLVELSKVIDVQSGSSLQSISRVDRQRAITIYSNINPRFSQQTAIDIAQNIAKKILPPDCTLSLTGAAKTFEESFQTLIFALFLGILVSYMVLGSQFNSFLHPFTVLLALPFSLSGAFLSLYLANESLNLFSMIGLILLMGIVKKNSILLVDFTNQRSQAGLKIKEALLEACPIRLRPIIMTSLATIVGAVPAALSIGPGEETRVPMAISIIGGVIISTLFTLFVVPCTHLLLSSLEKKQENLHEDIT